jgi:hypothetical protein
MTILDRLATYIDLDILANIDLTEDIDEEDL